MSLRDRIDEELDSLRGLRDELRVQIHLGELDAKEAWHRLEKDWEKLEARVADARERRPRFDDLKSSVTDLAKEIGRGYEELRRSLDQRSRVRDVMTRDPAMLVETDRLHVADDVMALAPIRHLPVLGKDDELVGLVSQRDLFRASLARILGYDESDRQETNQWVSVADVMSSPVATIRADADLGEAAGRMREARIGSLIVVDEDGAVEGIITETDLLAWVEARAGSN